MSSTAVRPPAIVGVCPNQEATLETVFPSVCSTGFGRLIGQLMESIPFSIGGIKLSHVLFGIPAGLIIVPGYLLMKMGSFYVLTNRSVQIRKMQGTILESSCPLADVIDVAVDIQPGQQFYTAGDLSLLNARGDVLLRLPGVVRPDRFRRAILESRDSRRQNDESLKTISARR